MENKQRIDLISVLIVLIIAIVGACLLAFTQSNKIKEEAEVLVESNKIEIKAEYGISIDIKDISEIKLVDSIPTIETRVNGADSSNHKRGDFKLKNLGVCKIFIDSNNGPFIYIIANNKYTIINYNDATKTKSLYEKLKQKL
jgi:uncharacterized protein YpmB